MAAFKLPGVHIKEIPSDMRTIAAAPTSICAFIGSALRGEENEPILVQSFAEYQRRFGELSNDHPMGFTVDQFFRNGGSDALIVRVSNGSAAASLTIGTLNLIARSTGTWSHNLTVAVTYPDDLDNTAATNELFNLTIEDTATGAIETFNSVSMQKENPRFVSTVLEEQSRLVLINGDIVVGTARPEQTPSPSPTFLNNGGDGNPIGDAQISNGPLLQANREGLWALEKADSFNLLCIPPFSLEKSSNSDIGSATRSAAAFYCEENRAIYIVDPLYDWKAHSDIIDATTGLDGANWGFSRSANAALYFPRVKQPNPLLDERLSEFAPCGVVAGIIARTDATRGVWKAPAGLDATLNGVSSLTVNLTDSNNGALNRLAVNCLRSFPVKGRVIWGSRTLAGASQLVSEWKYIPVRRTALFIEESFYRGTQWVVFEPNDIKLWEKISTNLDAFMQKLFRQGAFQGSKSTDAYFIRCDSDTTIQADIDNGVVNIVIGFAPLKPAEFVVIKLQLIAGQTEA